MGKFFCYILNDRIKRASDEYKVIGEVKMDSGRTGEGGRLYCQGTH